MSGSPWTKLDEAIARKRAEVEAMAQAETSFDVKRRQMEAEGLPTPVKSDGRICFGIVYFATEEDADRYAEYVRYRGDRYNGGWMHGVPCGRDRGFDHVDRETGKKLYAVTTA